MRLPTARSLLRACLGLLAAALLLLAAPAHAACSSPTAAAGSMNWSGTAMQFCNGTTWANIGGTALSGLTTDVTITSPASSQILSYNGSAWVNSAVGSVVAGTAGPSFMVNKNGTNQTVSAATYTKLTWSNEVFDTNNNFASDKFTPTVAGKYIITASVSCSGGTSCAGRIYKNGSVAAMSYIPGSSGASPITQATAVIDMNGSTDYVEAYGYTGGATTIDGAAENTYFTGSMLAPLASGVVAGTGSAGYVPYWTSGNAVTYDSTSGGQFYWNSTNHRLGIGTATPLSKLTVDGDASMTTPVMSVVASSDTGGNGHVLSVHSAAPASTSNMLMTVLRAGNVGIGSASPAYKLDVAGDIKTTGQIYGAGAASTYGSVSINGTKGGYSGINFRNASTNYATLMISADIQGFLADNDSSWDWYFTNGTLTGGTVPAARVSAGTLGTGDYSFTGSLYATGGSGNSGGYAYANYANYGVLAYSPSSYGAAGITGASGSIGVRGVNNGAGTEGYLAYSVWGVYWLSAISRG